MNEGLQPQRPILLVDDEAPFLRSLSLTLRSAAGFNHLLQCEDSREVSGLLAGQPVSLVLLDLTMPHLSGEELLPRLVGEYPEVPVIILSGLNQVDTAVRCMRSGRLRLFRQDHRNRAPAGRGAPRPGTLGDKQRAYGESEGPFFSGGPGEAGSLRRYRHPQPQNAGPLPLHRGDRRPAPSRC